MATFDEAIRVVRRQNHELERFVNLDDRSFVAGTTFGLGYMAGQTVTPPGTTYFGGGSGGKRQTPGGGGGGDEDGQAVPRTTLFVSPGSVSSEEANRYTSSAVLNYELEATVDALRQDRARRDMERATDAAEYAARERDLSDLIERSQRDNDALACRVDEQNRELARLRALETERTLSRTSAEASALELEARVVTLELELEDARASLKATQHALVDAKDDLHEATTKNTTAAAEEEAAAATPPRRTKKKKAKKPLAAAAAAADGVNLPRCLCGCPHTCIRCTAKGPPGPKRGNGLYALRGYIPQDPGDRLPKRAQTR